MDGLQLPDTARRPTSGTRWHRPGAAAYNRAPPAPPRDAAEAGLPIRFYIHWPLAALLGLILLACALCAGTYRVFGNFWDEPEHIAAGLGLIDRDQYLYDNQHSPLARLAAASARIWPVLASTASRIRLARLPDATCCTPRGRATGSC